MNKTIYIHIGFLKTGTTSIQSFLYKNSDKLLEHGIYYPHYSRPFQGEFCTSLMSGLNPKNPPPFLRDTFTSTVEDSWNKHLEAFDQNDDLESMIISCEWFIDFCQNKNLIDKLSYLKNEVLKNREVKIIVYLRPVAKYIKSLYQETVKISDYFSLKFPTYLEKHLNGNTVHVNLKKLLLIYGGIFGEENLIVRKFKGKDYGEFGLYEDFLSTVHLEDSIIDHLTMPQAPENVSIDKEMLEAKLIKNKLNDLNHKGLNNNKKFDKILKYISFDEERVNILLNKSNSYIQKNDNFIRKKYLSDFETELFSESDLLFFNSKTALDYFSDASTLGALENINFND